MAFPRDMTTDDFYQIGYCGVGQENLDPNQPGDLKESQSLSEHNANLGVLILEILKGKVILNFSRRQFSLDGIEYYTSKGFVKT
jgi:hypothetical protein